MAPSDRAGVGWRASSRALPTRTLEDDGLHRSTTPREPFTEWFNDGPRQTERGPRFEPIARPEETPVSKAASHPGASDGSGDLERPLVSVTELLARAREGDALAREHLFRRHYPMLRKLAHGRLPQRSRPEKDTDDIVQLTMLRATRGFERFDARWDGAWLAYLRQILFNCLRDEYRRSARLPDHEDLEAVTRGVEA